ncbi:hypothetical protein Tco_0702423 [Tanacetum coccineum]|uniref:Reverse transcriptase domain-containing protein n=1 Tax=Tanacetum coccineum TaxID=301880 RepID=A0ABQ4XXR5_9ASTR
MVGAGHAAYTDRFHELARLVPHLVPPESRMIERYVYGLALQICRMVAATEPKTMQKVVQISSALTDEAVRNGSIKKVEKRGNVGEPSKDRSGRDDNQRTRTGNVFATTVNPVGRENTGTWHKVWKSVRYGVSKGLDTAYWGFLGVGTMFDIFQNIHILYFQYGVLVFWIRHIDLVSFVVFGDCRHGYAISSLMDTAHWYSE